jgi:hypothetical protein
MNLTLSADEKVIQRARETARRQGKSLNQAIREYLQLLSASPNGEDTVEELFALMKRGKGSLKHQSWSRDEIHQR